MIITNNTGVADYIYEMLKEANESHKPMEEFEISVTESTKEVTPLVLSRRHSNEIEIDCQDIANTGFGTKEHEAVEKKAVELGYETEKELHLPLTLPNGISFVMYGKLDLYKADEKTLRDYKTCKEATYNKNSSGQDDEWDRQTTLYNTILDITKPSWYKGTEHRMVDAHIKDISAVGNAKRGLPTDSLRTIEYSIPTEEERRDAIESVKSRFMEYLRYKDVPDDELPLCSAKYRYAELKYKIYGLNKDGSVKKTAERGHANYDTAREAVEAFRKWDYTENDHVIQEVGGESIKCRYYCDCRSVCPYAKKMREENNWNV